MAYDRRTRHDVGREDLAWLTGVMWPGAASDSGAPSGLAVQADPGADQSYLVLPGSTRPWLLLPKLSVPASLRALTEGHRLSTRRQLAIRVIAGAAVLARSAGAVRPRPADLVVAPMADAAGAADLVGRLCAHLGAVKPVVLIGESDPNRKPTLQMVDRHGRTVGYAKIGWNAGTRAMVRREAAMLDRVTRQLPADSPLRAPRVVAAESFDDLGLDVLVTRPMPTRARRCRADTTPGDDIVRAVAAAASADGRLTVQPARRWQVWDDLRRRLDRLGAFVPAESAQVRQVVEEAVAGIPADVTGAVGGWHGDLVPWNLALAGGHVWAWDWEHAAAARPVGLDLLHHRFAVARHVRRQTTAEAVSGVVTTARERLPGLGVPPAAARAIVVAYLAERWLRAAELAAAGAGWDDAVHPGLVTELAQLSRP